MSNSQMQTEAKLAGAPEIDISDQKLWLDYKEKNLDSYGLDIMEYAERWARLMQIEMAEGRLFEEAASLTSGEADYEGMSGFTYHAAVHTLARCWKYGDQLRKWHNEKFGVTEDIEGTVNPAVLIYKKE